jgi:8-amino-7-oxononanoate synthase
VRDRKLKFALHILFHTIPYPVDLFQKCYDFTRADEVKEAGYYPYFRAIEENEGPVVQIEGRKMIMAGSNNYLGLTADPRVKEAAIKAIERYGTGCSGSRYLTGTVRLHEELEHEMADYFQKEACLLFSTGYQTAQGVIPTLCQRGDYVISDKDNHACIVAGNLMSKGMYGEVVRYNHDDMSDLERRISKLPPDAPKLIVSDGVFSTSGEIVDLPRMVELAKMYNARIMVDDAHAVGVIGEGGRGTASYFNLVKETDMTMGTFSKTFASLGGFVVGEERVINYIKHQASALIFSASPTPASVAAALMSLKILRAEPERMKHLIDNADYMRREFKAMGFKVIESKTGIVPVIIGDDIKTLVFWRKLYDAGVFVNAFVVPGVMQGMQMMRTSFMATHEKHHLDRILELFKEIGEELGVLDEEEDGSRDLQVTVAEHKTHRDLKVTATNAVHIRKVENRKDKLRFIRLPWDLYANEKNWVPPLEMDRMRLIDEVKNPFYKHATHQLFLAEDNNGKVIGRIAAIINHRHNELYASENGSTGFVGFFDSINDQSVANALFVTAEDFLRSHGMKHVRGPVSPSINDEVGLLVEGFEYPAAVMMPYHPRYYKTLWEKAGYGKVQDLLAWKITEAKSLSPKIERVTNILRERSKVKIRSLDMKKYDAEVNLIRDLYSRGWEENWGAVPLDADEITMLAAELKQIIDPDFILFADAPDANGKMQTIGFSLCIPDINQAFLAGKPIPKGAMNLPTAISNLMTKKKAIDNLRIVLLGVMPEYRGRAIDALLYREIMERAKKKGIKFGEASWVLEDNAMMSRAAQVMNGEPYKRYRVFEKPLYQGDERIGPV